MTHPRDNFAYHAVPVVAPPAAILSIRHNVYLVAEAHPGRQVLDQVHTVPLQLLRLPPRTVQHTLHERLLLQIISISLRPLNVARIFFPVCVSIMFSPRNIRYHSNRVKYHIKNYATARRSKTILRYVLSVEKKRVEHLAF